MTHTYPQVVATFLWPDNPAKWRGITEINEVQVVYQGPLAELYDLVGSDGERINEVPFTFQPTETQVREFIESGVR